MEIGVTMIASEKDRISIEFIAKHEGETRSAEIVLINKGLFEEDEFRELKKFLAKMLKFLEGMMNTLVRMFTVQMPKEEGEEEGKEHGR